MYTNRDVAQLWVEGRKDDSTLDEVDEVRFLAMVADHFWGSRHQWDRTQRGLLEKGNWERTSPALIRVFMTKRGAQWWETNKSISPPDFMREIDERIAAQRATLPKAQ